MYEIAIGSRSEIKKKAVMLALSQMGRASTTHVTCIGTQSGVNEQPEGITETSTGSENRARTARMARPQAVGLGIESGIQVTKKGNELLVEDFACVTAISNNGTRRTTIMSAKFVIPNDVYHRAKEIGFDKITVGRIVSGLYGGPADNPHHILSNGRTSRVKIIADAVKKALLNLEDSERQTPHRKR